MSRSLVKGRAAIVGPIKIQLLKFLEASYKALLRSFTPLRIPVRHVHGYQGCLVIHPKYALDGYDRT